jgi:hypothetical protein
MRGSGTAWILSLPLAIALLPACSPCSDGTREGLCGLEGICVQCVTDEECDSGKACSLAGECVTPDSCDIEEDCTDGWVCTERECLKPCQVNGDCPEGALCDGDFCYTTRCDPEGTCPNGWLAVFGTLECRFAEW